MVPLTGKPGAAVVVFTDATYTIAPHLRRNLGHSDKRSLTRAQLEPSHPADYAEYDRLVKKDKDALKSARMEKILGAIHNNAEQIPELKDRLKELVKEWK